MIHPSQGTVSTPKKPPKTQGRITPKIVASGKPQPVKPPPGKLSLSQFTFLSGTSTTDADNKNTKKSGPQEESKGKSAHITQGTTPEMATQTMLNPETSNELVEHEKTIDIKEKDQWKYLSVDCYIKNSASLSQEINQTLNTKNIDKILERWNSLIDTNYDIRSKILAKFADSPGRYLPVDVLVQITKPTGEQKGLRVMANFPKKQWGLFLSDATLNPIEKQFECPSCLVKIHTGIANIPQTKNDNRPPQQTRVIDVQQSIGQGEACFLTALYFHTLIAAADWCNDTRADPIETKPKVLLLAVFSENHPTDPLQNKAKVEATWIAAKEHVRGAYILLFARHPALFKQMIDQLQKIVLVPPANK
jgi:hypothetical protein